MRVLVHGGAGGDRDGPDAVAAVTDATRAGGGASTPVEAALVDVAALPYPVTPLTYERRC
ncbi:hypothetical protein BRD17_03735 [Halobacteriales archaeon SW_7_68_16]|nr:MAG: hypothetical protein BRD17_03735 [Halobacteriales archaeon SW_7_68_16]